MLDLRYDYFGLVRVVLTLAFWRQAWVYVVFGVILASFLIRTVSFGRLDPVKDTPKLVGKYYAIDISFTGPRMSKDPDDLLNYEMEMSHPVKDQSVDRSVMWSQHGQIQTLAQTSDVRRMTVGERRQQGLQQLGSLFAEHYLWQRHKPKLAIVHILDCDRVGTPMPMLKIAVINQTYDNGSTWWILAKALKRFHADETDSSGKKLN